jgi:hypothetical protein
LTYGCGESEQRRAERANAGAPGVDGVTFEQIAAQGVEGWLAGLREDLVSKTYRPDPVRRVSMSEDGKRGAGHRPQATAPVLDFTEADTDRTPHVQRCHEPTNRQHDLPIFPRLGRWAWLRSRSTQHSPGWKQVDLPIPLSGQRYKRCALAMVLCVLRRTVTATALTLQRCDSFREVVSSTVLAQGQPQSRRCP